MSTMLLQKPRTHDVYAIYRFIRATDGAASVTYATNC